MLTYDARAIAGLERLYASPQIVEQRRRLREAIGARPGESGLDVGCGVAYLACELAREVSPGGRIAALDSSRDAVEASRARIAREGLEQAIEVREGDAARLPYADASFDFVVAAQVYSYVPDVAGAVREAARVLKRGGRLVVLESDWDLCTWASADPALTRRVLEARGAAQFAHAHLPRELHAHFLAAGMRLADVRCYTMIETRYDPESFGAGLIASARAAAIRHGVAREEADRWANELRSRSGEGEWFFCLNRFIFTALR
jgi:ubiquinone/menaquinone biosynthesis C-methylase UbiE